MLISFVDSFGMLTVARFEIDGFRLENHEPAVNVTYSAKNCGKSEAWRYYNCTEKESLTDCYVADEIGHALPFSLDPDYL